MYAAQSTETTATATVKTGNGKILGGVFTAGAAADATLTLYDNTAASGTVIREIRALTGASKSLDFPPGGLRFGTGLHAVISGAGAKLYLDF